MNKCSIFSYDIGISLSSNVNFDIADYIRNSKTARIFIPKIKIESFKTNLDFEIEHIQSLTPAIKKLKIKFLSMIIGKIVFPHIFIFSYIKFLIIFTKKRE